MAISWQKLFVEMVNLLAKKSRCQLYQIGAVFVRGKQLLQVGYNGPTAGDKHCDAVGCAKKVDGKFLPSGSKRCRGAHAEMNAIVNAAKNGINLSDCDLYCTYSPCYDCAKHLNNLGVKRVFYVKRYEEEFPQVSELFAGVGIELIQITDTEEV